MWEFLTNIFLYSLELARRIYDVIYVPVHDWIAVKIEAAKLWVRATYADFVSFATSAWNWVKSAYNTVSSWITARLGPVWTSISNAVATAYNNTKAWLATQWDKTTAWVATAKAAVETWANKIFASVEAQAVKFKDWVTPKLTDLWNKLSGLFEPIKAVTGLFNSDNLARTAFLIKEGWENAFSFLMSPLAFILAYLKTVIIEFLSYALAYALGTTKYKLPPWPSWTDVKLSAGIGVIPGGPGVPGGTGEITPSGLAKPLSSLSVSGYRFGPGHYGTDYGLTMGQSVYACHAGEVIAAGVSTVGYGVRVIIQGGDWWSLYGHLQSLAVSVGSQVSAGQVIALGDTTGNSTGPHLHLELKYKNGYVNPEIYL